MDKRICLNRSVLDFMASVLDKNSFVLEIGSGWSSRWFSERCGRLLSLETSPEWVKLVCDDLDDVENCLLWVWHAPDLKETLTRLGDASLCHDHLMRAEPSGAVLAGAGPGGFDLVLVDGIEVQRNICAQLSWPLIRSGGWLVLDDAQREVHSGAIKFMNQFGEGRSLTWQEGDIESAKDRVAIAWQKP